MLLYELECEEKKMGKKIAILLIVSILIVSLIGCGGELADTENGGQERGMTLLTIGTASVGGAFYPMGGALANLISNYVPSTKATATTSNGTLDNLASMKNGNFQFGFNLTDSPYQQYHGIEGQEKFDDVRSLVMIDQLYLPVIVAKNAPYETFADLKGSRIGTGLSGSGTYFIVEEILKAYGMSYDDVRPFQGGISEQATALKDGNLDAFIYSVGGRGGAAPGIIELVTTFDCKFLPIETDVLLQIQGEKPYYAADIIPKGWVDGLEEDIPALSLASVINITADVPDDVVYEITKAIFEHKEELESIHGQWKLITKETAAVGVPTPLHPGAEKYYNENGFPIMVLDDPQ